MGKNLLIVESPSKAKTLKKYLGKDFEVLASYGHVRDLVPKSGAVDTEHDFAMKYQLVARNKKHIDAIVKTALTSDKIYLATDPDREGEAISWHLQEILKKNRKLKDISPERVAFNEITQTAVQEAIAHPRKLSQDLIDAQQTRRALDYLVGFNLSPLLWKKIQYGLSAGRTQSPALRLICEREAEIEAFQPQEYWSIHLDSHKEDKSFTAKLIQYQGTKLSQLSISSQAQQEEILTSLQNKQAFVSAIEKKQKKRKPTAPFSTSTMQQEASRKLSMSTSQIMRVAQQLFEGIDLKDQTVGLITYMRTDSVTLSKDAIEEIRSYIKQELGKMYCPATPNRYTTKTKNAQEAHEAIRPTSITRIPTALKPYLSSEQLKLYRLIWQRTLASQMASAQLEVTTVDIAVEQAIFRTSGQVIRFDGFLAVYQEGADSTIHDQETEGILPSFLVGEELPVDKLWGAQHFTQAPPRYNEASLVKTLEEYGIGRPSTYATIISTLKERNYAILEKKHFKPTDTGKLVNKFLSQHFSQYIDYNFTAKMEDELDLIANGKKTWLPIMHRFWNRFHAQMKEKENLSKKEVTTEELDEICPKCKKHHLQLRHGRYGQFVACTGYPECNYTRNINQNKNEAKEPPKIVEDKLCPQCGGSLIYRQGRYGPFISCGNYPKCKYIESINKPRDTEVICPKCKAGHLLEKKSRYGKTFYGCSCYPECSYAVWSEPISKSCPHCHWPILTLKTTKKNGTVKLCPQKECGYSIPVDDSV